MWQLILSLTPKLLDLLVGYFSRKSIEKKTKQEMDQNHKIEILEENIETQKKINSLNENSDAITNNIKDVIDSSSATIQKKVKIKLQELEKDKSFNSGDNYVFKG